MFIVAIHVMNNRYVRYVVSDVYSRKIKSTGTDKTYWTEAYDPENPTLSRQLYASDFLFQLEIGGI